MICIQQGKLLHIMPIILIDKVCCLYLKLKNKISAH